MSAREPRKLPRLSSFLAPALLTAFICLIIATFRREDPAAAKTQSPSPVRPVSSASPTGHSQSLWSEQIRNWRNNPKTEPVASPASEQTETNEIANLAGEVPLLTAVHVLAALSRLHVLSDPRLRTGAEVWRHNNLISLPPLTNVTVSLASLQGLSARQSLEAVLNVHDLLLYQTTPSKIWLITYKDARTPEQWRSLHKSWLDQKIDLEKAATNSPQSKQPNSESASDEATKSGKIYFDLDLPIQELILVLARLGKLPIVIDPRLKGPEYRINTTPISATAPNPDSLTRMLAEVPPRDFLESLLEINGLTIYENPRSEFVTNGRATLENPLPQIWTITAKAN